MKLQIDIVYLMVLFFAVSIGLGASIYIFTQLFSGLNSNPTFAACTTCTNALAKGAQAQSVIPNLLVLMFLMACVASVILSAFIDSSPVFLIFVVICLPVEILMSFVFHDAWFAIADGSFIGAALTAYPSIALMFEWMPIVALIMAVLIALVTYIR